MATDKQLAANRRNAAKSTGPRTQAGKARSRMNALRHGLAAEVPPGFSRELREWGGASTTRVFQIEGVRTAMLSEISDLIDQGALPTLTAKVEKLSATDRYMRRAYAALKKSYQAKCQDEELASQNWQNEPNSE